MAAPSAVVRSSNLADFRRFALTLDLDPVALMRRAGIDRRYLDDPELTLPVMNVIELLEISAVVSGIEDFGLRLGEARGLPDFGPAILMLREERTLRDALKTLVSLLHLHTDALCTNLDETCEPILTLDLIAGGAGAYAQTIDVTMAGLTHVLRWLLGEQWAPAVVCFKHAPPASRTRYDRFFRCPVDFLQEMNGIVLRRRDLERKMPSSSPVLRRQVERYIRTLAVAPSSTYVHRVTQVVAMALPRGEARAETVAHYLGTDRRTLNRRLARSGLNYSSVLQTVRRNLSVQYLMGGERALAEVAELVGFASLSAFTHWFRRSFAAAPGEWRKQRLSERPPSQSIKSPS